VLTYANQPLWIAREEFTRPRCVVKLQLCKIFVTRAPETRTQPGIRQWRRGSDIRKTYGTMEAYGKIEESDIVPSWKKVLADTSPSRCSGREA
jgi:hypothetical protein